jgi:hypothetical protein
MTHSATTRAHSLPLTGMNLLILLELISRLIILFALINFLRAINRVGDKAWNE